MKLLVTYSGVLIYALMISPMSGAQEVWCKFRRTAPLMGTNFILTFYAPSSDVADRAAAAAFDRVRELNQIFSDYLEDSEVTKLSKTAGLGRRVMVSEDLWYLLKDSGRLARQSKGAFDITIGPLTKLWRKAVRQQEFPDQDKIEKARKLVNYRWVKLYPKQRKVELKKSGMRLDFGGIAKGYAVDEAYKVLEKKFGITSAIVDGGGDFFVAAPPPDSSRWEIKKSDHTDISEDHYRAIASSGDTYRFLQWRGKRYSHILDPSSGLGKQNSSVITVAAPNTTLADALATAFTVASEKVKKKLIKKYDMKIID